MLFFVNLGAYIFCSIKILNKFAPLFAGIAQLVEHNLAKVGVAGPSPVSRSSKESGGLIPLFLSGRLSTSMKISSARMVELVDTQDLKSCGHRGCAGSSPAPGTENPWLVKPGIFFSIALYTLLKILLD